MELGREYLVKRMAIITQMFRKRKMKEELLRRNYSYFWTSEFFIKRLVGPRDYKQSEIRMGLENLLIRYREILSKLSK